MPSCPKCGNAMSSTETICPSCGNKVETATRNYGGSRGQQQVAYVKEITSQRPIGATVLSGLAVIGAIGSFLLAASYGLIPRVAALSQFASSFGAIASAFPYFLGLVGIISLVAAFGFLKGKQWAWKVGILASVLEILTIVSPNLLGFVIGIISVYLLMTRPVKQWLHK